MCCRLLITLWSDCELYYTLSLTNDLLSTVFSAFLSVHAVIASSSEEMHAYADLLISFLSLASLDSASQRSLMLEK